MKTAILISLLLFPCFAAGEVFKCANAGKVTYSTSPCISGAVPYESRRVSIVGSTDSITLTRDETGRFSLPGSINGISTTFTVDTGSTFTTISGDFAEKLGIHSCVPVGMSRTVNGDAPICRVTLSSLSVGGFNYSNIAVDLSPTMRGEALLGNDLLSGFQINEQGNVMVLSK